MTKTLPLDRRTLVTPAPGDHGATDSEPPRQIEWWPEDRQAPPTDTFDIRIDPDINWAAYEGWSPTEVRARLDEIERMQASEGGGGAGAECVFSLGVEPDRVPDEAESSVVAPMAGAEPRSDPYPEIPPAELGKSPNRHDDWPILIRMRHLLLDRKALSVSEATRLVPGRKHQEKEGERLRRAYVKVDWNRYDRKSNDIGKGKRSARNTWASLD